jgi:Cys-rich repeat protein
MRWTPVVALGLCAGVAQAQTFPADSAWTALTRQGVVLVDPGLDTSLLAPARDDIGDLEHPAAYVATDGTYLYVRTRVSGNPKLPNGAFLGYGWGCEISTDQDPSSWEVFALLDGHEGAVEVWANTKGRLDNPADPGDKLIASHTISASNARAVPTSHGTFVDLAVSLADLGVTPSTPLQFVCGANNDGKPGLSGGLDSDIIDNLLGGEWTDTASDPFLCSGTSCAACATNDHCGASCGACGGTTPICDPESDRCIGCNDNDGDEDDATCPPGTTCRTNGACLECTSNAECTDPVKPICNLTTNQCGPCTMDSQCPTGEVCDLGSGACVACVTNAQCGGTAPICQSQTCVPCASSSQCPDGTVCDTASDAEHGACVPCVTSADCKLAADPICGANHQCGPCTLDPQCAAKDANHPACSTQGTCVECTATDDSLCQTRQEICDTDSSTCVACTTNADCAQADAPICGTDHACHGCADSSECPAGTVCDTGSGACVGCATSADCKNPDAPICTNHICVPCTTDPECDAKDAGTPACDAGRCVQCTSTASELCIDHSPALVCDLDTDACVECLVDADCQKLGHPADRPECGQALACIACTSDAPCHDPNEPACQGADSQHAGACGQCSATNKTLCTGATPECDVALGLCVACLTDGDCKDPARPRCDAGHQCVAACTGNGQCPTDRPVCATSGPLTGTCTECEPGQTAHCTGTTPVCDAASDTCVGCTRTTDCPSGVCASVTETCVGCETSDDCHAPTPSCDPVQHQCVAGCTSDDACPPATPVCNLVGPLAGTCTQCSAAEHGACITPDSICQIADGTCVACLTNEDCSVTPATPHCNGNGQCVGCENDNDCNGTAPACQPSGVCGQCSATNATACPDDTTCDVPSGRCVGGGAGGPDAGPGTPPSHPDGGTGPTSGRADAGLPADQPPLTPDKDTVAGGGLSCSVGEKNASGSGILWVAVIGCAITFANRRRFR